MPLNSIAPTFLVAFAAIAPLHAQVLISDTFGTDEPTPVADLDGRTADVGGTWIAFSATDTPPFQGWVTTNGTATFADTSASPGMAGFDLEPSYFDTNPGLYELAITFDLPSADGGFFALGFMDAMDGGANGAFFRNGDPEEGTPWMFIRQSGSIGVRNGAGSGDDLIDEVPVTTSDVDRIALLLDTRPDAWTLEASYNDTIIDLNGGTDGTAYVFPSNPSTIGAVGIGAVNSNTSGDIVRSFTLAQIPEPSTVSLIGGLLAVSALVIRRFRAGK